MPRKAAPPKTIALRFDVRLIHSVQKVLDKRGIDVKTYIEMYLRSLSRDRLAPLLLADVLNFGKYTGEVVETVCRADPKYIDYIIRSHEPDKMLRFDSEVNQLIDSILRPQRPANVTRINGEPY